MHLNGTPTRTICVFSSSIMYMVLCGGTNVHRLIRNNLLSNTLPEGGDRETSNCTYMDNSHFSHRETVYYTNIDGLI